MGWDWADPLAGLLITVAILAVLRQAAREIYRRLMDAVDPGLVDQAEQALLATPGVLGVGQVRLRWIGHRLRAECEVIVDPAASVVVAHQVAVAAEHQLLHAMPRLSAALVHADPSPVTAPTTTRCSPPTGQRPAASGPGDMTAGFTAPASAPDSVPAPCACDARSRFGDIARRQATAGPAASSTGLGSPSKGDVPDSAGHLPSGQAVQWREDLMWHGKRLLTLMIGGGLAVAGVVTPAGAASAAPAQHGSGQHAIRPGMGGAETARAGGAGKNDPFCKKLGVQYQASSGAQMFCYGPRLQQGRAAHRTQVPAAGAPRNVDAATVSEDVSPTGVAAQGQSEVSIGAVGRYVTEAWNDATGFVSACGAPSFKEELTGLGFSVNGGRSFTDLGGLPNLNCHKYLYEGDPSVAAYRVGGHDYFYISSLYDTLNGLGLSKIALDACEVSGSAGTAALRCGKPVTAAISTQCEKVRISRTRTGRFCSFLDKDYLAIDPATGRLYVTYSDFLLTRPFGDPVAMSVCDLGNSAGGTGPAGGTPAAPVCEHGTPPVPVTKRLSVGKPYFTVAKPDPRGCENEGSYPAVDVRTGNVYVGYEYNWGSSLGFTPCEGASTPLTEVLTSTPARCLRLAPTAACRLPARRTSVPVVSMEGVTVPGYNRFPVNDFPRLAVSDRYQTVSMVWNDARLHPFGDILLQTFHRGSLRAVQSRPVVLDRPHHAGLDFLPALRTATAAGRLDVSWYSRASVRTADTGVRAALDVSPLATATPRNTMITNRLSDWDSNSSLIIPNFGDYTDDAIAVTGSPPYLGKTLYVAWSDGRLGIPQPFEAHLPG